MIPNETTKELIVVVENEAISVAVSPPVIDAAIVVGAQRQADGRTMLLDNYDPVENTVRVLTADGLEFFLNDASATSGAYPAQQVKFGAGNPNTNSVTGSTNQLYIDTDVNTIWRWVD